MKFVVSPDAAKLVGMPTESVGIACELFELDQILDSADTGLLSLDMMNMFGEG